ncbi:MAG: ABC transporter permease [Patescibacteria group bacterium]
MYLKDIYKTTTASLSANKKRAALTMLGIVIGITAVIVVMSVGAGAQSLILNQVKTMGSNLIGILPGGSDEDGPPASVMGIQITTLTNDDADALAKSSRLSHVVAVASYVRGMATITWQNQKMDTSFYGTGADYVTVEDVGLAEGRFFSSEEAKGLARVAVIGSEVKDEIFGSQDAVGQKIKIGKETFEVIGVVEKRGVVMFANQDTLIFIPVSAAQKLLLGYNHLGFIRVKVDQAENLDETVEQIEQLLRERHDITDPSQDDFSVQNSQQALDVFTNVTDVLSYFLAAIASISLLVGGIGIMNIMLVTVTERTKEIGLRKALGAKRNDLLIQFLLESVILTLSGGVFGILIGSGISALVAGVASYLGYNWDLVISPFSIILACSVCILIGLGFGYYPAQRAAKLDPITALRYE